MEENEVHITIYCGWHLAEKTWILFLPESTEGVYQGAVAPAEDTVEAAVVAEEQKPEAYTLTRKMNVRKEPSLSSAKLKVLDAGTVVEVKAIQNDWLCLTDDTFILYEDGKNARKQQ